MLVFVVKRRDSVEMLLCKPNCEKEIMLLYFLLTQMDVSGSLEVPCHCYVISANQRTFDILVFGTSFPVTFLNCHKHLSLPLPLLLR